jgi:hypothetical protein
LTIRALVDRPAAATQNRARDGCGRRENAMPLFLIERQFADALQLDAAGAAAIKAVNEDVGVNWLFSFLSADRKKTYCLYEAPSAEAIREAARLNALPADVVIEVSQLSPEALP